MASLKDIRKRIQSVKSTRQITRAMKMVAAAKLKRSQDAILNARPYAYRIYSILLSLLRQEKIAHPLLVVREEKKIRVVVLAGDRGLCGSFNANIFKETQRFIARKEAEGSEVSLACIGKKSYDFFRKKRNVVNYYEGILGKATYNKASAIADEIINEFLKENLDAIYLIYNEFKSAIQVRVAVERLIPISTEVPPGVVGIWKRHDKAGLSNHIFEPERQKLLDEIIPRHFNIQFFRAVLESIASEHGSRMSAMENATKNASEMIDSLTLDYNKARQASITKELMEIVSGVESMK